METIKAGESIKLMNRAGQVPVLIRGNRAYVTAERAYYGKRATDIVLAGALILLLLSWLTLVFAVLIKLDSRGTIFFRQKRVGKNGRIFSCLKFRTMFPNAVSDLLQASYHDERITPVGAFLRRFHLDELPQLINILKGEMSFVGPRPHMLVDEASFGAQVPFYVFRQSVRPGLTGLAQVRGFRGPTPDFQSVYFRAKLDNFYVQNQSPLLDLKIIASTLLTPFSKL
jgi:putative colanic acid biosynthesis UDP-glucose lipid carrier transferase